MGQSLVQRNSPECDRDASIMSGLWPTRGTCANRRGYFIFDTLAMDSIAGLFAHMIRIFEQSFSSVESSVLLRHCLQ
jgi:hypothetical protein